MTCERRQQPMSSEDDVRGEARPTLYRQFQGLMLVAALWSLLYVTYTFLRDGRSWLATLALGAGVLVAVHVIRFMVRHNRYWHRAFQRIGAHRGTRAPGLSLTRDEPPDTNEIERRS